MLFSERSIWTMVHGIGLGGGHLPSGRRLAEAYPITRSPWPFPASLCSPPPPTCGQRIDRCAPPLPLSPRRARFRVREVD